MSSKDGVQNPYPYDVFDDHAEHFRTSHMNRVFRYNSTDNPYEIVLAIWGGEKPEHIMSFLKDAVLKDGRLHMRDYRAPQVEMQINRDTYVIRDPKGFRIENKGMFQERYINLHQGEVLQWLLATERQETTPEQATPTGTAKRVGNSAPNYINYTAYGDDEEAMEADAIRRGFEVFGSDADLEITLGSMRHSAGKNDPRGQYWVSTTIKKVPPVPLDSANAADTEAATQDAVTVTGPVKISLYGDSVAHLRTQAVQVGRSIFGEVPLTIRFPGTISKAINVDAPGALYASVIIETAKP